MQPAFSGCGDRQRPFYLNAMKRAARGRFSCRRFSTKYI